ncbi:TIGR04283 family arsenosugar biosynthesis glycosyltransferase [Algicella marina]|uniref:Glycosyltransferase n=1 Tax=Algicella marina TaxID=2683284 RepID=A0A6P1T1B8_9RHOB|nr:TIGR04283 family arsenosugar biosynthesis glycosyltransferase [Algicella marina]QHQ35610.1 glycosyltransferase [Algicella marina]
MPAPISIIIPTLRAENTIGPTLSSLAEGLTSGLIRELIISEGGESAEMAEIADQAGAVFLTGPAGRGGQLQRAADTAVGDWLLFLHADTRLAPGWPEAVRRHLSEGERKAGYFRLRFDAKGIAPAFIAHWTNLRARMFGLPFGDQGLLVPRQLYDKAGGYRNMPLMEDVALVRALRGNLRAIAHPAETSAIRYRREGWCRRGARNQWLLLRYFLGVSPETLAREYAARQG